MATQKKFSDIKDPAGIPMSASIDGWAEWVGISQRTARNQCANKMIPASKIGRAWRINLPEALKAFGLYPGQAKTTAKE